MSMPIITALSSPPEVSKNVREASFSSYLDGAEATFVLKLGGLNTSHNHIGKNKVIDREIDVFDAEKYFNDELNQTPKDLSSQHHKKDAPIEILAIKEHPPLSIRRSESSCNSRSTLLHTISRNQKPTKVNNKSFLATIGCKCSCADNYSTDIDETSSIKSNSSNAKSRKGDKKTSDHLVRKKTQELRVNSEGLFTFPVINSKKDDEAAKRKSPSVMSWGAIAPSKSEEVRIPSISREMHNDSDSDSSSDLFEIESLSKGNPFLSRQASYASRTPSNCYAPSEASIEWSVVTASAADFSEEFTVPCPKRISKEAPKLRPSILSGCKNHRAVNIAGDAHRPIEHNLSNATKSITLTTTRYHHESKVVSFDAKNRQQSFDPRILSQKPPANSAHLLYTL